MGELRTLEGLWLVNLDHVTWILASDWSVLIMLESPVINHQNEEYTCHGKLQNLMSKSHRSCCCKASCSSSFVSVFRQFNKQHRLIINVAFQSIYGKSLSENQKYQALRALLSQIWSLTKFRNETRTQASDWSLSITWPQYWPLIGSLSQ